jgi:hypothetical protein
MILRVCAMDAQILYTQSKERELTCRSATSLSDVVGTRHTDNHKIVE